MKIIFGTMSAEQKFIRINGRQINRAYKTGWINYSPQNRFLPKNFSVQTVANYYLEPTSRNAFLADTLFTPSEIIKNLSGGVQRYVETKLLLHTAADYVLLDEPFQEISPIMVEALKKEITTQAERKGIIVCDHQYRHVLDIAHRCYLLNDGALRPINSREELVTYNYLRK